MLRQSLGDSTPPGPSSDGSPEPSGRMMHHLLDKLPAGAYLCDADGLITYYNEHARQLWGREPRLGDPVDRFCGSFKLFSADGAAIAHDACWMALALRNQKEYNGCEILVERPDGTRITALAHANPIFGESGVLIGAVNVLVDISAQKRAERALEEADRAKSEFLATVSHEIRTPLNAIIGYLDLLEMEIAGPLNGDQRAQVARTRDASRHLLSLINEVLDFSRLEAGQMQMRRELGWAAKVIDVAVAVTQPLADGKGIELRYRHAGGDCAYAGDPDRVRQLLINLLSNAIKFSEPGDRIEVTAQLADRPDIGLAAEAASARWVCFRVRDHGIGIPSDQLERIFEPFIQVEATRTRTHGGTGLGLTISRRLARLMGGDLTVESAVGVGSVFTLWLPAAVAGDPEPRPDLAVRVGTPTARQPACAAAGQALLGSLDEVLWAFGERLQVRNVGPGVRSLPAPRLVDHTAAFVADLAVSLRGLEDARDPAAPEGLFSEIQRHCATEHGRQRGRLGWAVSDLEVEFAALEEELTERVRALDSGSPGEREQVVDLVRACLVRARAQSVGGLREIGADL